jgi:hypothetical protein
MSDQWSESAVAGDASAAAIAEARLELARSEQDIASIKNALRHLGQPSDSEDNNTLKITWMKVVKKICESYSLQNFVSFS